MLVSKPVEQSWTTNAIISTEREREREREMERDRKKENEFFSPEKKLCPSSF